MATYKVLQDIEAEDKFVGPLTLKQFILAGITLVSGYLIFFLITKHLWILAIPLIPVLLFSGFLAFPWGRDQPTEVWLLAKIRFMLKPRRRIWDQTGMQELVTITAPKHEEHYVSDNLSQTEVKSRLKALAETIDSRGWAVKNASVNLFNQPAYAAMHQTTDRLVSLSEIAREVPNIDVQASDDILDEQNNPTAQHLNQMIAESSQAHRDQTLKSLQTLRAGKDKPKHPGSGAAEPPTDFWFMHTPGPAKKPSGYTTFGDDTTVHPGSAGSAAPVTPLTADEQKILKKLRQQQNQPSPAYGHTRVIEPLPKKGPKTKTHAKRSANRDISTSRTPQNPAILGLANNNDLTVATIARQANKPAKPAGRKQLPPDDEVVVKLH